MPAARSRGSTGAAVYNETVYFVNGNIGGHRAARRRRHSTSSTAINTDTWTILPDSPTPRDHMGAAVLDDKLYVMGG